MSVRHSDITIVGGGLIGASMALLLARSDVSKTLSITLIDAADSVTDVDLTHFDPRVVALSPRSQSILQKAGIWSDVLGMRACAYQSMHVWDADGTGSITFDSQSLAPQMQQTASPRLGYICENKVLLAALHSALQNYPAITHMCPVRVTAIETTLEGAQQLSLDSGGLVQSSLVQSPLVLAADGGGSKLRELAGFDVREWDYGHQAIVTTLEVEKPHDFCAWQRFAPEGPLAYLPLSRHGDDAQHVSIVWSVQTSYAEQLMSLDDDAFCDAVGDAFEQRLGRVIRCDTRRMLPLKQRSPRHYYKPGIALVGDAAHTIHPLAGQGANLGLYDVQSMMEEIERACRRGVALSDMSILRRYARKRQPENLAAMASMEVFKRGFGNDNLALRWLRNEGLSHVDRQPVLKQLFSHIAAGGKLYG